MYKKRKSIQGSTHKVTFKELISFKVKYMKKDRVYVISHPGALIWGYNFTERKAFRDLADCIQLEYNYYHRMKLEGGIKYYKKIIKSIRRIK